MYVDSHIFVFGVCCLAPPSGGQVKAGVFCLSNTSIAAASSNGTVHVFAWVDKPVGWNLEITATHFQNLSEWECIPSPWTFYEPWCLVNGTVTPQWLGITCKILPNFLPNFVEAARQIMGWKARTQSYVLPSNPFFFTVQKKKNLGWSLEMDIDLFT